MTPPLGAARHSITVHLSKPPRRKPRRQFMGVSWSGQGQVVGVQIAHTFEGLPACGRLCGGDVILRVCGQPVNTAEDVVYHWHHAPPGTDVQFDLQRCETHVFCMSRSVLTSLNIVFGSNDKFLLPVVASTEEFSEERLRLHQVQGVPLAGDLILSIGGTPVATSSAASAVLAQQQQQEQEAPPSDEVIEIAVQRGWPEPREGEVASDCCCCSNGTRTKVPKPKKLPRNRPTSSTSSGAALAEMAPPLLLQLQEAGESVES